MKQIKRACAHITFNQASGFIYDLLWVMYKDRFRKTFL